MGEKNLIFKNPAGNIAVHNYGTGHDYLLWEDGKIETLDTANPENIPNESTAQELNSIIGEIEGLQEEEMERPE